MRLIATDMDGTLLNSNHQMSAKNKEAIQMLQEKGIEVIAATGRSFFEAVEPVKQAGLTLPYICMNGAEVRNETGDIIATTHLRSEDINDVMGILNKHDIYFDLFIHDYIYALNVERQIAMFIDVGLGNEQIVPEKAIRKTVYDRLKQGHIKEIENYESVLQKHQASVYKILGICSNDKQFELATQELGVSPNLAISSSGKGVIEVNHAAAQKGIALEKYSARLGIQMKDVMVIGDNYNDVSMMERAGRSVAMGNAPEAIKQVCSHETTSCEEDGFALAVEAILSQINGQ